MAGTRAALCCESGGGVVVVGCGLTGDGTPATPAAVAPAAGQEAWPWSCADADASTLKCDPDTGQLWTPPEHGSFTWSWRDFSTTFANPYGATAAPVDTGFSVGVQLDGLDFCRVSNALLHWRGDIDVGWTAGTQFWVGLGYTVEGTLVGHDLVGGILNAGAIAGRQLFAGSVVRSFQNIQPGAGPQQASAEFAIHVFAGEVTIFGANLQHGGVQLTSMDVA